jgi:LytS/YehU family sensor histidine kinase
MEHTRGAAPVHVRSTVPPALRSAPVPHLGVFPLVESAVLCGGRGPLEVEVRAGVEEGRLRVDVRDDGPTPLAGRRAHPGWEPVALLEERLRELPEGGFRLDFADLPGRGVRASLAVPFREAQP